MSVFDFKGLLVHVGHNIECVTYGDDDTVYSVDIGHYHQGATARRWQDVECIKP